MTVKQFKEILNGASIWVDSIGKKRDGSIIVRQGFFYRHGNNETLIADRISTVLDSVGIAHTIIDKGEVWKTFRGGASLANSSHWYVIIKEQTI